MPSPFFLFNIPFTCTKHTHSPFFFNTPFTLFFQTLLLTPHRFFSIFTPHGFLILHSICFSTHTSSFGSSSSTSFFPFSFLFSMEKGDGEFGWFVMDGYGRCGYRESSAWYKKRLWYQLHNILLNFTLTYVPTKKRRYDKFTIKFILKKTQTLIEGRLLITEDLVHYL